MQNYTGLKAISLYYFHNRNWREEVYNFDLKRLIF
jgi:hypothetical protein